MTQLMTVPTPTESRTVTRYREGSLMLFHEALARSRQREAEEAARRYRLVRAAEARQGRRSWPALVGIIFRRTAGTRAAAARRAARAA